MTAEPLTLAQLRPGVRLTGVVPGDVVTLLACDPIADDACEVVFKTDSGTSSERIITSADIAHYQVASTAGPAFDANPNDFRLAAEALRIKYAALYDPMAAVNSSEVDPLPHQIRAVYEEMLPRVPLRFLLADDPGAGKTIMAGLYLKELLLRSDCERAIIVAPGGLVEQWQDELSQKFGLHFKIFNRNMVEDAQGKNVFEEHPFLIARMDQLSRNEDLLEQLADVTWDVAVVDEAHRMSAHYSSWAGEVKETKRFQLGRLLSDTARNFLLMTATPHAGKEEDFQLFMSLLDEDRFEGKYRPGVHRTDTDGLMRRMVKEDLLTFEGRPLFPERRAYTVEYELSDAERRLYEDVTAYVRTEMGRAERIAEGGDRKRGNNVGFALTVLQRRLASSPAAILRSLERRRARLSEKLRDIEQIAETAKHNPGATSDVWATGGSEFTFLADELREFPAELFDDLDELSDSERERLEQQAEQVVDLATAAQTIPELRAEIASLDELIEVAREVRRQDEDKKWVQLRTILDEQLLTHDQTGEARKIIIFTEHRDTLDYLQGKIASQFGRNDSVITIHGGVSRKDRKQAREDFTHNPNTAVLLATDAAGEGLNLQRAHLMVNYDLPWNPNRIEQRFGRIHRIGQQEVCHLWNMVAKGTREGDVFTRLLAKIEQMSTAYNGNLFNVLGEGEAFSERSLRDLLIEAIRYGDQPEVKAKLDRIIDEGVSDGLDDLLNERALHPEMFSSLNLQEVRARMEAARERRLQPGYIASFFIPAFERVGGRIRKREPGRYEITRVPTRLIEIARRINRWAPVSDKYERVTFRLDRVRPEGLIESSLIAPGNPLLDAVIEATIEDLGATLRQGTVFVDRRPKQASDPELMFIVEQRIDNSAPVPDRVSHHFDYPVLDQDGAVTIFVSPPYLDYDDPVGDESEAIASILKSQWVREDHSQQVRRAAYREGLVPRMEEIAARVQVETERTRRQVRTRLLAEMNYWDREHDRLEDLERKGKTGKFRAPTALNRSKQLEERLNRRLRELDEETRLVPRPGTVRGTALVIPSDLLSREDERPDTFAMHKDEVERRAVNAVLEAERALGRDPIEMHHNNPGFDVKSIDRDGFVYYIEVKGRIEGADTFTITSNEVTFAQTQGGRHRLALVSVSPESADRDELRYIRNAFDQSEPWTTTRSLNEQWNDYWARGGPPQ